MSNPFFLLKTSRFAPLFIVQFLAAFNDNLLKNTLAIILTFKAAEWTSIPASLLAPLVGAVFIAPFFFWSGLAGVLADKYDKATLTRYVKLFEILLMLIASVGFIWHSFFLLLSVIFGMGLHSTLFGPIKYAILPQHLHDEELINGNALIESATFASILLGTIIGGILSGYEKSGEIAAITGMIIASIGYIASRKIPSAPSMQPQLALSYNFLAQTFQSIVLARRNQIVFLSILAISWFWLYGALLLSQFPALVKIILMGNEATVTLILSLFTVGIAVGSILCEQLSHHKVRPSLIMIGAVGMSLFGIDFAFGVHHFHTAGLLNSNPLFWHILADLVLIGIFGGLYSVPLYTLMQNQSDVQSRSRIIAANNILNALFMVVGAVGIMIFLSDGWSISEVLLGVGVCSLFVTVIISIMIRTIYSQL